MTSRLGASARAAFERQGRAGRIAALSVLAFALVGIGGPLVGRGSFTASEQLIYRTPWVQELATPATDGQSPLNDTYEQYQPAIHEWASRLRHGDFALTSPYEHGGTLLAAWNGDGLLDPLNLPWAVMPVELAPGYVELLVIATAAGFMYLFCRRVGAARAPAWIGGLAYAASGFQIAWTNWPQTRVGAVTPAIFWAIERLVQRRRWRDVSVLAMMIAWSFAAGFPSVTVMVLVVAAVYTTVRLLTRHARDWRAVTRDALMSSCAALLGVGLMAVQLTGLNHVLSRSDLSNREFFYGAHSDRAELATALLPSGLGLPEWGGWVRAGNIVEAQTFVGGAVALLALGMLIRRRSVEEARGVVPLFAGLTVFSVVVVFVGGPLLKALQVVVPPLSNNFIGRWRSVLGFGVATLAAVGATRWSDERSARTGSRRWAWYAGAALVSLVALVFVALALTPVPAPNRHSVAIGVIVLAGSVAATTIVLWLARHRRSWAIGLVAPVVALEALALVLPYWHRSPAEHVYPSSPLVSSAAELEGHDRVEGISAIGRGATSWYRLRTATGYSPATEEWADLLTLVIPTMPRTQWTTEIATIDQAVQQSALLDRLGVRYLVVGAPTIAGPLPEDWTPITESPGGVLVERASALPRIRWASTSLVLPDRESRLAALSAGVDRSTVVLDAPSGAVEGGAGDVVSIDEVDSDVRRITVRAGGNGYLVVADSYDPWWKVTIDGRDVPLLRADHAMMAVAVPSGDHLVEMRYTLPTGALAASAASGSAIAAIAVIDVASGRRRRRRQRSAPGEDGLLELVDPLAAPALEGDPAELDEDGAGRGMDEVASEGHLHDGPVALGDLDEPR